MRTCKEESGCEVEFTGALRGVVGVPGKTCFLEFRPWLRGIHDDSEEHRGRSFDSFQWPINSDWSRKSPRMNPLEALLRAAQRGFSEFGKGSMAILRTSVKEKLQSSRSKNAKKSDLMSSGLFNHEKTTPRLPLPRKRAKINLRDSKKVFRIPI